MTTTTTMMEQTNEKNATYTRIMETKSEKRNRSISNKAGPHLKLVPPGSRDRCQLSDLWPASLFLWTEGAGRQAKETTQIKGNSKTLQKGRPERERRGGGGSARAKCRKRTKDEEKKENTEKYINVDTCHT